MINVCGIRSDFTSNATLIPVYLVNASIQNKTTAQHIWNAGSDSSNTAFCSIARDWQTKASNNCIKDSRDKNAAVIGKREERNYRKTCWVENCITLEHGRTWANLWLICDINWATQLRWSSLLFRKWYKNTSRSKSKYLIGWEKWLNQFRFWIECQCVRSSWLCGYFFLLNSSFIRTDCTRQIDIIRTNKWIWKILFILFFVLFPSGLSVGNNILPLNDFISIDVFKICNLVADNVTQPSYWPCIPYAIVLNNMINYNLFV